MANQCYLIDRALQGGIHITLESHHINHANFKKCFKQIFSQIETR